MPKLMKTKMLYALLTLTALLQQVVPFSSLLGRSLLQTLTRTKTKRLFRSFQQFNTNDLKFRTSVLHQTSQSDQELSSLKLMEDLRNALKKSPHNEPILFNLALLSMQLNQLEESLRLFEKAVVLNPKRDASWFNIGVLSDTVGNTFRAIEAYEKVIEVTKDESLSCASYNNVIALYLKLNLLEQAAQKCNTAVNLFPENAAAWCSMGIVFRISGNPEWAKSCFEKAAELIQAQADSVDTQVVATVFNNLGVLEETFFGDIKKAENYYRSSIFAYPEDESSLFNLAIILRDQASTESIKESINLLESLVSIRPDNVQAKFQLTALKGDETVDKAPGEYVTDYFDAYAKNNYEDHVTKQLQYKGPELIWDSMSRHIPYNEKNISTGKPSNVFLQNASILEIGVGSGLMGKLLRMNGCSGYVKGCDLSPAMIEMSQTLLYEEWVRNTTLAEGGGYKEKSIYDDLCVGDCAQYLEVQPEGVADLIIAADVLVYIGNLNELFENARKALKKGGYFCFTVENLFPPVILEQKVIGDTEALDTSSDDSSNEVDLTRDFKLLKTGRFAHNSEYLENLAGANDFGEVETRDVLLRWQGNEPIYGILVLLKAE